MAPNVANVAEHSRVMESRTRHTFWDMSYIMYDTTFNGYSSRLQARPAIASRNPQSQRWESLHVGGLKARRWEQEGRRLE
jgi:hypothetical protein